MDVSHILVERVWFKEIDAMKVMETERLLLRPLTLEDTDGFYQEIYSDRDVLRYYSGKGVRTPEATLQHLTEHLAPWRDEELGRHAVILKENGTFLGQAHFTSYVNSFARMLYARCLLMQIQTRY